MLFKKIISSFSRSHYVTAHRHYLINWSYLSVASLLLLSGATAVAVESAQNCHINVGSLGAEESVDYSPLNMGFEPAYIIGDLVYLTLVDVDVNGNTVPRFAKKIEFDTDNKTIKMHLDNRCRWSDGHKITAADMLEGIKLTFSAPDKFVVGREYFANGKEILTGNVDIADLGVTALDEDTLEIAYVGSKDMILKSLRSAQYTPVPSHYLKQHNLSWPQPELLPISSGAYQLSKVLPNRIQFQKNPHYCSYIPVTLETVDAFTKLPENSTLTDFMTKKVDVVQQVPYRYIKLLRNREDKDNSYTFGTSPSYQSQSYFYLFINQLKPELADPNVTEAIRLAIDHKLYLSNAMFGENTTQLEGYTPKFQGYTPEPFDYGSDNYLQRLKQARALMVVAGYSAENRLEVELPLRVGHYLYPIAKALGSMLQQIYITPKYNDAESGSEYYKRLDDGEFGAAFMIWSPDIVDPSNFLRGILDKRIVAAETHNTLLDKMDASENIQDTTERFKLLASLEQDLERIGHIIPLYAVSTTWALRKPLQFGDLATLSPRNIHNESCGKGK